MGPVMRFGQDDPLELILPPAAELLWGAVAFGILALVLIVAVVLVIRAVIRGGSSEDPSRDELLERAVRAEVERDRLREELEELRAERGGASDSR